MLWAERIAACFTVLLFLATQSSQMRDFVLAAWVLREWDSLAARWDCLTVVRFIRFSDSQFSKDPSVLFCLVRVS